MAIQITITAETAADTIQLVKDLAETLKTMNPDDIPTKTEVSTLQEREPVQEVESEPKQSEPEPEISVPSVVEVRKKAQEVGQDPAKKPKIKELLKEFGVPNVSSVPEDRRVEFIQRLEEL